MQVQTFFLGGGGGGEGGSKSFDFNILGDFRKIFYLGVYVYINESIPPTHTQTLGIHACTSKCTRVRCLSHLRMRGSRFSLFFVCLFHRGAHMLRSFTSFFFSNGKLVLVLIAL